MEAESLALPTMETPVIPELTQLAKRYRKAIDARLKALGVELPLKEQLIEKMHELGLADYRDEDLTVTLKSTEKVKVKLGDDEDEE